MECKGEGVSNHVGDFPYSRCRYALDCGVENWLETNAVELHHCSQDKRGPKGRNASLQTRKNMDHGVDHALPFFSLLTCIYAVVSSFSLVRPTPIVPFGTPVPLFPSFHFSCLPLPPLALSVIHLPRPGKRYCPEISFDSDDSTVETDFSCFSGTRGVGQYMRTI